MMLIKVVVMVVVVVVMVVVVTGMMGMMAERMVAIDARGYTSGCSSQASVACVWNPIR